MAASMVSNSPPTSVQSSGGEIVYLRAQRKVVYGDFSGALFASKAQ